VAAWRGAVGSTKGRDARSFAGASAITCAVTIDVHDGDDPRDVIGAAEWLAARHISATFFVPSVMLASRPDAAALRTLPDWGHEVGSHGHRHDYDEAKALISGTATELRFLAVLHARFEDFYLKSPRAFRSPYWCYVGPTARRELARLGYLVDSSSTPQRLPFLSSLPFEPGWVRHPRGPHYGPEGVLEIPTTSFLCPAGAQTFVLLRDCADLFLRALALECVIFRERVLTLQFHPADFAPHDVPRPAKRRPRRHARRVRPRAQGRRAVRRRREHEGQPVRDGAPRAGPAPDPPRRAAPRGHAPDVVVARSLPGGARTGALPCVPCAHAGAARVIRRLLGNLRIRAERASRAPDLRDRAPCRRMAGREGARRPSTGVAGCRGRRPIAASSRYLAGG
jgi:hypothetical protein